MEIKTYSRAGSVSTEAGRRQVGNTTVESFNKAGQKHTVYGQSNKSTKAEMSAYVQGMLDNVDSKGRKGMGPNKDLQDYAERMYKVKG